MSDSLEQLREVLEFSVRKINRLERANTEYKKEIDSLSEELFHLYVKYDSIKKDYDLITSVLEGKCSSVYVDDSMSLGQLRDIAKARDIQWGGLSKDMLIKKINNCIQPSVNNYTTSQYH